MLLEDRASAKYMVIEKDLMLVYSINERTSVNTASDIVEVKISSLLSDKENSKDSIRVWRFRQDIIHSDWAFLYNIISYGVLGKVRIVVDIKKDKESLENTTKCWLRLSHRYNEDYKNMLEERIYS